MVIEEVVFEDVPDGVEIIKSEKQNFWLDTVAVDLGKPWGMVFLPNGDMLISDRGARLLRLDPGNGSNEEISGLPPIFTGGQGGLLDITLHPNYTENGWLYLSYSKSVPDGYTTVIARCHIKGNSIADFTELFVAEPGFTTSHHFGCRMAFNNGYLFFSVGDRGQMFDAQKLDRHNGKIMRIHDDGQIPADNPFVSSPGALAAIWSYGHRNPQGLAVQKISGELYSHEHGPKGGDELNLIKGGANYGWPEITFGIDYDGTIISNDTAKPGLEQPLTYWVPSIAPCGMIIYNGNKYPSWLGNVFLGGLAARSLFRLELFGSKYRHQEVMLEGIARVRNVGQSPDGFIYVATESPGVLYRLVPSK